MWRKIIITIVALLLVECTSNPVVPPPQKMTKLALESAGEKRAREIGCNLTISPGEPFIQAFQQLKPGQLLCLRDGIYHQLLDIPSNMKVRALYDGMVEIDGRGIDARWEAILTMNGENSVVRGLKVHHASYSADACNISGKNNIMRLMSCSHGGQHKHKIPLRVSGKGHLIEDSWFYGEGRYVVQCFKGKNITFRRNVARWDSTAPNFPKEPNATFSIYNCSDITIENNVSLDYGEPQTPMRFGGDFYSPQNPSVWPEGNNNNFWLGNIAINHSADTENRRALRLDPGSEASNNYVSDFFVRDNGYGIVGNSRTGSLIIDSCTFKNVSQPGFNLSRIPVHCKREADISKRYENRRKTDKPLFPWFNEDMIKADMCKSGERQSEWCSSGLTLTEYILRPK